MPLTVFSETQSTPATTDPTKEIPEFDLVSILSYAQADAAVDPYRWLKPNHRLPATFYRMVFSPSPDGRNGQYPQTWDLSGKGLELLKELKSIEPAEGVPKRPILLVGYSFGACIAKDAVVIAEEHGEYRHVFERIVGMLFLGAINDYKHVTAEKSHSLAWATELPKAHGSKGTRQLHLERAYQYACNVSIKFAELYSPCDTVTLYETRKTLVARKLGFIKSTATVITHDLAANPHIGGRHDVIGANVDHVTMATVPLLDSPHAAAVMAAFEKLVSGVLSIPSVKSPVNPHLPETRHQVIVRPPTPARDSTSTPSIHQAKPRSIVSSHKQESSQVTLPCRMIRPYTRHTKFVGRQQTLKEIEGVLDPQASGESGQKVYALVGLGGVGKTQTALRYVSQNWDKFQAILWAQADSRPKLSQSFTDFAYDLGLVDGYSDQEEAVAEAKRWFDRTDVPWLVVFDNVDRDPKSTSDNRALLEEFWPAGHNGSVLITSQDRSGMLSFAENCKELGRLTEEHAMDLLYLASDISRSAENEALGREIVKRVDRLAFAVSQAAWLIKAQSLTFINFLDVYDNRKLIEDSNPIRGPGSRYAHSLSTVWSLQFQLFHDNAKLLMNIVAFLDPDKIEEDLLGQGATHSHDPSLSFIRKKGDFIQCRANLTESPLVSWNGSMRVIWIHRLVQETCHLRMEPDARQKAFERAYNLIYAAWPQMEWHNRRQHKVWKQQETKINHIVSLGKFYQESISGRHNEGDISELHASKMFAELLYHGAWYYIERGFLSSSEPLLDIAKELCDTRIEDPELILADIYGGYGAIDSERNELEGTLKNFQSQYKYLMKALDKNLWQRPHVREALALGGLAQGYAGLDRLPEAEEYYYRCIDAWKEAPGEPTIYQSHLSTCLCFQGKLDEAENTARGVIEERSRRYGPRDTTSYRTGLLYYALGNILKRKTRNDEAYEIQEACLVMFKKTCGEKHHCTADAYYKVGWHLQNRNEHDKAVDRYETALRIYEDKREYVNEIARTKYMLGITYLEMRQTQKGNQEILEAEALRKDIMGKDWVPHIEGEEEESYDRLVNFWSR